MLKERICTQLVSRAVAVPLPTEPRVSGGPLRADGLPGAVVRATVHAGASRQDAAGGLLRGDGSPVRSRRGELHILSFFRLYDDTLNERVSVAATNAN